MGVHVLDVLVRPVEAIPEGQGGELVEEIRITAAGSAGGTALVAGQARRAGRAPARSARDAAGDMLLALLERDGVDTALLVRRDDVQTSASVLPIRPSGERPAFHVVGANGSLRPRRRAAPTRSTAATHLHLGGPEFMGGEAAAPILARAREHGVVTSADVLAPGEPGLLDWIAPALPRARLPAAERRAGARLHRRGRPRGRAAARCSSAASAASRPPAAPTASCSSTPRAPRRSRRSRSRSSTPPAAATRSRPASCAASPWGATARDAAVLGCAAAALVAQGLGSDHGDFDLAAVEQFATASGRGSVH